MQLKDATAIVASIIKERNKIPLIIDTKRYLLTKDIVSKERLSNGGKK